MFEADETDPTNDVLVDLIARTKSADVDARIDAVIKLQTEFEKGYEVGLAHQYFSSARTDKCTCSSRK